MARKKSKLCGNPDCKKKFTPIQFAQKYCSYRCANLMQKNNPYIKKCKNPKCYNEFKANTSLQTYCCNKCYLQDTKSHRNANSRKLKAVSKKRSRLNSKYIVVRLKFLAKPENIRCAVFPRNGASEVHHKMGKIGYADAYARENDTPLLIDDRFFLAVSREGHRYIEENPDWAKSKGFSMERLKNYDLSEK